MIFRLSEDVVKKALLLELEERMGAFQPEFYVPHHFSKRFERKMRVLEKRADRPLLLNQMMQVSKRVAMIVLAAMLTSFATAMSVDAFRIKFFEFIEQKFREYSIVFFEPVRADASSLPFSGGFEVYEPMYIPDGFELVEESRRNKVHLYYQNDKKEYIDYCQSKIDDKTIIVNTEGVALEMLEINGQKMQYYKNVGNHTMMWDDEVYSFIVSSNVDYRSMYRVVKSVKINK